MFGKEILCSLTLGYRRFARVGGGRDWIASAMSSATRHPLRVLRGRRRACRKPPICRSAPQPERISPSASVSPCGCSILGRRSMHFRVKDLSLRLFCNAASQAAPVFPRAPLQLGRRLRASMRRLCERLVWLPKLCADTVCNQDHAAEFHCTSRADETGKVRDRSAGQCPVDRSSPG